MKKTFAIIIAAAAALLCTISCCNDCGYGYEIKDGVAVYNTPERPADQISMIGFATDPIEKVRVGFIGLGDRGDGAVNRFTYIDGAEIVALCGRNNPNYTQAELIALIQSVSPDTLR